MCVQIHKYKILHHYTQNDINREPKVLKMWLTNKVNKTKKKI